MNKLERVIYDVVKGNPKIKFFLRDTYQSLLDIIPIERCISAYPINVREGFFFGFHDHTPFSPDGRMLLSNRYSIGLRMPGKNDKLEVGYFHGETYSQWNKIDSTIAWNWQQGCKLQWVGQSSACIYNDFVKGKYISKIHDIKTGKVTEIPYPISSVSSDGKWAVGYSFERVERYFPGYGYSQKENEPQIRCKIPDQSWLYLVNLESGERKNLFDIAKLAHYRPENGSLENWHFFSHALFGPTSERIAFLHRWVPEDTRDLGSRLFSCDLNGENLHLFQTKKLVSHIGWRNSKEIVAYCRLPDGRDRYVLFNDKSSDEGRVLGEGFFSSDGHPSFSTDGRWMLTDTYPDRFRRRFLILYDIWRQKRYDLAMLYSPRDYAGSLVTGAIRCDLHPRWNRDNTMICFDSAHTGIRSLCTITLGDSVSSGGEPLVI